MPLTKYLLQRQTFYLLTFIFLALSPLMPTQKVWAQQAWAQQVPVVYEHFNTAMTLSDEGVLHVRIVQQIRFDETFSGAFYAIPVANTTSIANVELYGAATQQDNYELDTVDLAPIAPNYVEHNGDEILVDWDFEPTNAGDVRLFVLEYDAYGVVWVYPDQDFVRWQAMNDDRSGVAVEESVVSLTLPEVIPMDQVTTTSNLAEGKVTVTGQTLTFTANQAIPDGVPFEIETYFPHGLLDVGVREWQRNYDGGQLEVEVDAFHADLTINADGTLNVHEETRLAVRSGALHQGFRSLNLLTIDEIDQPSVSINGQPLTAGEGDCSGCYQIYNFPRADSWVFLDPETEQLTINEENGGAYNVDWYTPLPVQAGESVTATLDYHAIGALRVNPENQLLTWQVVPDYGQQVEQASLRVILPPGVTADEVTVEGPGEQGNPQLQTDGSLLFRFDGPVVPGAWQIALTLPADATDAQPPLWQQQFEDVMAHADAAAVARARNTLILRVLGILAIIAAILGAVVIWFRWGRRRVKETLGGYVSEPPSRQSPALVAYLVDRKASDRGVLGSIFYLASFKVLEIDLDGDIKLRRLFNEQLPARLNDAYGASVPIPRHLQLLFDQVLLPGMPLNEWVTLDSIGPRLRLTLPDIYASMAADLQKFFIHIPGSRSDTIPGIFWFVTYATLLGLIFVGILPWFLGFAIGFAALLIFVAWSASHETGQGGYSDEGTLEADRWRRFKTYLLEIKKYGDQGAAQEIIDRYFGYAVALGVETVVLAQAAELGTLRPIWMPSSEPYRSENRTTEPLRLPRSSRTPGGFPWIPSRPSTPSVQPDRPTLAGMSAQLGESLQQASSNLGNLLSTAAGDANSAPRTVVVNSLLRRREIEWKPNTPVSTVLDDILKQSVTDARQIQAREIARRESARSQSSSSSESSWASGGGSGGGSSSRSSSRSSGGFGRSSSSSSTSSRSSSSSSSSRSSSTSRSGGGGRSGFR